VNRFKNKGDAVLFSSLAAPLIMIFGDLAWYAKSRHGIDLVVTETITTDEEDRALNRESSAHNESERRAMDIRANNIDAFVVSDIVQYINNKEAYKEFHYLSNSGIKRLAYLHGEGENFHIHLALHKKYSYNLALLSE